MEIIRKKSPEKDFMSILSHAFENFKGVFLYAFLYVIIGIFAAVIISMIMSIFIPADPAMEHAYKELIENISKGKQVDWNAIAEMKQNQSLTTVLLNLVTSSLLGALLYPLSTGILYINHKFNSQENLEIEDLFIGYRQNTKNIMLYGLMISFLVSAIILIMKFIFGNHGIFDFIGILLAFYVAIVSFLGLPILFFENKSPIEALKKSISLSNPNFFTIFITMFLGIIASVLGIVLCCVGVLLTAGFLNSVQFSSYCAFCGTPYEVKSA